MFNDIILQQPLSRHAIKQQKEDGWKSYLVNQALDEPANSTKNITVLGRAISVSSLQETGAATWSLTHSSPTAMTNTSMHIHPRSRNSRNYYLNGAL